MKSFLKIFFVFAAVYTAGCGNGNEKNSVASNQTETGNQTLTIPLNIEKYTEFLTSLYPIEINKDSTAEKTMYSVNSNDFDRQLINFDDDTKEIFSIYCQHIENDKQIKEAYAILNDLIDINKKP